TLSTKSLCFVQVRKVEHGHRCESHQGAVSGRLRIFRTRKRLAVLPESVQGGRDGASDVEALSGAAQKAIFLPAAVPSHLVVGIEGAAFDKARTETERH